MSKGELIFRSLSFTIVFLIGVVCLLDNVCIGSILTSLFFFTSGIYLAVILKELHDPI